MDGREPSWCMGYTYVNMTSYIGWHMDSWTYGLAYGPVYGGNCCLVTGGTSCRTIVWIGGYQVVD